MLNIRYNLKHVKHDKERPINLIIRWDKKRLIYAIGEKILPKYFETERNKKLYQRVRPSFTGYSEFNARLDYIESTAATAFRQFMNDNHRTPEPRELKRKLDIVIRNVEENKKPTLMQFISSFIEEASKSKINRDTGMKLAKGTVFIYRRTLKMLKEFELHHGMKLDFDCIDLEFYDRYVEFLSVTHQLSNNTVGKQVKTLKSFLNEAVDRGLNVNLAFKNKRFKVLTESVYKIYLNESELREMYSLDLSDDKPLERVRDLFIVGCWTGLRFSDLVNIAPENITADKISIKTQKTGEVVVLPLHWMVRNIMKKYSAFPNSLPPAVSNVKMNKYLKDRALLVPCLGEKVQSNITRGGQLITESNAKWECVTVHTARRSFATNLYLDGVSSLTIMKLTTHKSEKVFLSYLKASAEETANVVQNHWLKKDTASGEGGTLLDNRDVLPHQPVTLDKQNA